MFARLASRRFGLSSLLALVTLAAVAMGFVAAEKRRFTREGFARQRLVALCEGPTHVNPTHAYVNVMTRSPYRGQLDRWLADTPWVEVDEVRVFVVSAPAAVSELAALTEFAGLRRCQLTGDLGDEVCAILARCPSLGAVDLADSGVTDAGVARLAALPRLEELDLAGTQATWRCLASLRDCASLRQVRLSAAATAEDAPRDLIASLPFKVELVDHDCRHITATAP